MAREMKDSGVPWVGDIPKSWTNKRLKYLTLYNNKTLVENTDENFEFDYIDISSVEYGRGITQKQHLIFRDAPSRARRVVRSGDVIISTVRTYLKAVATIEESKDPLIVSTGFIVLEAIPEEISPRFLHYAVLSDSFISLVEAYSVGISYPAINASEIINFYIPLPSLIEQTTIANFLDSECSRIDDLISLVHDSIEECRKLKQSVITKAITKGIRSNRPMKDSEIPWIGSIPDDWSLSTIGKTILFEGGSQPPLTEFVHEPQEGYIRLIQNRDYKTDAYTTYVPIDSVSKFCTEEDVMIGRYGPPMFVMHRGLRGAYNVALMKAIPQGIDREWMSFVLQEFTLLRYVESFSKRAAGQDGVNPKILKNYPLPLPDMEEQREIADYLRERTASIEDMISKKEELIKELNNCKKSLIYEYATGKKEVLRDGVLSISAF